MKNILSLIKIELISTKRSLINFTMGICMPIIFFLVFSGLQNYDSLEQEMMINKSMLISMTIFSSISFALFTLPFSIKEDTENNWLKILNSSSVIMFQYYIAKFFRIFVQFLIAIVLVFIVGHVFRNVNMTWNEWIVSGLLILLGSSSLLSIGLLISTIKSQEKLSTVSNIVYMSLSILGGLWFPTSMFPKFFQNIAEFIPTNNILTLVNSYLFEDKSFNSRSFFLLVVYAIIFIGIALILKRKSEIK